jgi:hypothetical protein
LNRVIVPDPVLDLVCQIINSKDMLIALHTNIGIGIVIEEELIENKGVSSVMFPL